MMRHVPNALFVRHCISSIRLTTEVHFLESEINQFKVIVKSDQRKILCDKSSLTFSNSCQQQYYSSLGSDMILREYEILRKIVLREIHWFEYFIRMYMHAS